MAEYEELADAGGPQPMPTLPVADRAEKFSYWFDNFFASDPMAKPYVLCVVNVLFMTVFALCFHVAGSQDGVWSENFWMGFTFAADMAEDDHGGPFAYWHQWIFRAFNLTFSFGGAFVFGLVINFLSDFINSKLDGMKEGKPRVIEQGHTLILGWNDRMQDLISQLCQANDSEGGAPIVILADNFGGGKPDMDEWMNDAIELEDRLGSMIITRYGSRIETGPLKKCAVTAARSIIILSECSGDNDEDDAAIVRTTLALTAGLAEEDRPACHFVIELMDIDNKDVAMLGVMDGVDAEKKIKAVISNDIVGKLMIQSAREIPLSTCFGNLCCFDGSECYFETWPSLTGTTFREACYCFKDAVVMGVRYTEEFCMANEKRPVELNPPGDYVIQEGDKILVLAEDNDTYEAGESNETPRTPVPPFELPPLAPENILLCGWREDFHYMIMELDKWVPSGSRLFLLNGLSDPSGEIEPPTAYMKYQLQVGFAGQGEDGNDWDPINFESIEYLEGDPTNIKILQGLGIASGTRGGEDGMVWGVGGLTIEKYQSIIVLCYDGDDPDNPGSKQEGLGGDSRVMVSMLIFRELQRLKAEEAVKEGKPVPPECVLVSEIRDPRTQQTMNLTGVSDSVVGNQTIAMILAQISEDADNAYVFEDLFSEEGMEMHVKDSRLFVADGEALNFWDLVGRCQLRGMIPIGWVRKNGDHEAWLQLDAMERCVINPANKDEKLTWNGTADIHGDKLIVISED
jgi:hypothetical protein